jgi:hypothetical protein
MELIQSSVAFVELLKHQDDPDRLKKILNFYKLTLDSRDKNGNTVLHLAAMYGLPELTESLLDKRLGADPLAVNLEGETPLFTAIVQSCGDMMTYQETIARLVTANPAALDMPTFHCVTARELLADRLYDELRENFPSLLVA